MEAVVVGSGEATTRARELLPPNDEHPLDHGGDAYSMIIQLTYAFFARYLLSIFLNPLIFRFMANVISVILWQGCVTLKR